MEHGFSPPIHFFLKKTIRVSSVSIRGEKKQISREAASRLDLRNVRFSLESLFMKMNTEALSRAANEARGLAMDAVHACNSGHLGLPLGCAEIGAVLYGHALRHNPDEPRWINRDRFVLSAGHGSMFLYSWLHLSGYPKMTIDEVKN